MDYETKDSESVTSTQSPTLLEGKDAEQIDYQRLGEEVEVARRRAEVRRQSADSFMGTVSVGLAILGTVVGFVTGRWWVGLLAFFAPLLPFRVPRAQWLFELSFGGVISYATSIAVGRYWGSAPIAAKAGISVAAGVVGMLVHATLIRATSKRLDDLYP